MKKLRFYLLSLKNSMRYLWNIAIILIIITAFTFLFSSFFGRLGFDAAEIKDTGMYAFFGLAAAVMLYAVLNMLYVYSLYLKKSEKRITIYRMVGARKSQLVTVMCLESFLIFLVGLLVGVGLDYLLHSFIEMMNGHTYLTGGVFLFSAMCTLIVPAIALVIVSIQRVRDIGSARAVRS